VLRRRYDRFVSDLAEQVRQRKFDLIVLPYDRGKPEFTFLPTELVQEHYHPIGELDLPMDWQPGWTGVLFEPKPP
jgi:hypothetical protein